MSSNGDNGDGAQGDGAAAARDGDVKDLAKGVALNLNIEEEEGTVTYFKLRAASHIRLPPHINEKFKFKDAHDVGYLKAMGTTEFSLMGTRPGSGGGDGDGGTDKVNEEKQNDEKPGPSRILPMPKILEFNGTDLSVGFHTEQHTSIQDFKEYHDVKQLHFQKWMVDQKYFYDKESLPSFVCPGGRVTEILLTPMSKGDRWEFYAIRHQGVIFLYDSIPDKRHPETVQGFCGIQYKRLVTAQDAAGGVNEYEKVMSVTECTFGDYKMLLLTGSEIDQDGNKVNVRAYNPGMKSAWRMQSKFLSYWANSVIAGVKEMLVGIRDDNNILQDSKLMTMNDLWAKTGRSVVLDKESCYNFAHNVLKFIKSELPEDDRYTVKHFRWAGIRDKQWAGEDGETPYAVRCKTITDPDKAREISHQILPNWFIDGAFNK